MYRFWRFDLKQPIHAPFLGVFGAYFPLWRHPSSWSPIGSFLGGNTSFEPLSVSIYASVWPGCVTEKKDSITKKFTKVLHLPYLMEASTGSTGPIRSKNCKVGDVYDVITCAKFQIEVMGYSFIRDRIFDFPIDFCMGLTSYNSAALRRCLWFSVKE